MRKTYCDRCNKLTETEHSNWIGITNQKAIEKLLNMLKEKDKEIQFQKDINKQEKDRHKQAEKSLKGQIKILKRDFKIVDQECSRLERKEEKQDKIIDLMSEWISERCLYIDEWGNSCEIIQDSCNKIENCKLCIKQYFEKRLEDGN